MNRTDDGQFDNSRELTEYTDLYDEYSGWLTAHIDKQNTIDRRKAGAEAFLTWCEEEGHDPLTIEESEARAFVLNMINEGLADTTISSRYASVSKFYHYLLTDSRKDLPIEENPNSEISLRKDYNISNSAEYVSFVHQQGKQDIIAPSYESLKPIFDHPTGSTGFTKTRNELICRLCWQTALRSDELSRVRLDNIDRDERDIQVRSSKLNREDHPDLFHRHVWWEPHVDYLLYRYLEKREEKASSPYFLVGNTGEQLSPSYISRVIKKCAHKAGIQEPLVTTPDGSVKQWLYTAHRLRHSRITHLANKTSMDLNFVRMLAGHAKIQTTLNYVNADWEEARNAYKEATNK